MLLRPFSRHSSSETQISAPVHAHGNLLEKMRSEAAILGHLKLPKSSDSAWGVSRNGTRSPRGSAVLGPTRPSSFSRHSPRETTTFALSNFLQTLVPQRFPDLNFGTLPKRNHYFWASRGCPGRRPLWRSTSGQPAVAECFSASNVAKSSGFARGVNEKRENTIPTLSGYICVVSLFGRSKSCGLKNLVFRRTPLTKPPFSKNDLLANHSTNPHKY